ncbi:hypothetical protein ACFW7J_38680, partial [Streptomyces sp. NPDC059525]|uniref:hypothetical protein n=1 Tax=Streptomyces sp. NPDC059525 TaxID=3346857 RepID=UPI00368E65DF
MGLGLGLGDRLPFGHRQPLGSGRLDLVRCLGDGTLALGHRLCVGCALALGHRLSDDTLALGRTRTRGLRRPRRSGLRRDLAQLRGGRAGRGHGGLRARDVQVLGAGDGPTGQAGPAGRTRTRHDLARTRRPGPGGGSRRRLPPADGFGARRGLGG